jgi:glutamate---cysteine ligase / carboxylate-amine ligase
MSKLAGNVADNSEVGLTFGVEEEFHIVDPATGDLAPASRRLLRSDVTDAEPELSRSMVETATEIHTDLGDLRKDLLGRRRHLAEAAARIGLAIVGAGTVPAAGVRAGRVFPNARYEWMAAEYRQLVEEQQVCACQVHVSVKDRDLAVRITRRIRGWLPTLLALSASSPCFNGEDTGYASYRSVVVSRWPTVGPPPDFASADDYDRTVTTLVESGVSSDAGMIYFDARLSARYPTIEVRIADGCPSIDDAVLLAALSRALVLTAARADRLDDDDRGVPQIHQVLLRAATWRAARSGLTGQLIDPLTASAVPAAALVQQLLAHIRPVLEERDEWDTVTELTEGLLARGSSSHRQRQALESGISAADLVAALAAETTSG